MATKTRNVKASKVSRIVLENAMDRAQVGRNSVNRTVRNVSKGEGGVSHGTVTVLGSDRRVVRQAHARHWTLI